MRGEYPGLLRRCTPKSPSEDLGLSQWRLGYAAAPHSIMAVLAVDICSVELKTIRIQCDIHAIV